MCQILPYMLPESLSDAELYRKVNALPIDYLRFALGSYYGSRMYGVHTGAPVGGVNEHDTFVVNSCIRGDLWNKLVSVTSATERMLGYTLSSRYHLEQDVTHNPLATRIQCEWAGVSAVSVGLETSDVLEEAAISPYVATGLSAGVSEGISYVDVPIDVLFNPADAIVRLSSDNGTVPVLATPGYPKRVGSDWRIALNTHAVEIPVDDTLNIQSRQYVYVDVETDEDLLPYYPETTQKIPLARPVQQLNETTKRYWLFVYTLVNPAFYEELVNLVEGEYYKLTLSAEFRTETEVEILAEVNQRCRRTGEEHAWSVALTPVDAERGILEVQVLGLWETLPGDTEPTLNTNRCIIPYNPQRYQTTISFAYKTDPQSLPLTNRKDVSTVLQAVLHRVAADLQVADCGCKLETGFIAEQQKSYATQLITPTGVQLMKTQYGDLHGHAVYAEKMSKVAALKARML